MRIPFLIGATALVAAATAPLSARTSNGGAVPHRPAAAPVAQEEGDSSGLSGYLIGAGALAAGVAAILLAGGDDDNANSP